VEVNGGVPAGQNITSGTPFNTGAAAVSHVRVLSGPMTNPFVIDLWGTSTGATACEAAAIRHSAVP
jgi:hypothetical protein